MISKPTPIWGDVRSILANKNSLLLDNVNEIPTSLIFLTNGSIVVILISTKIT
jgi:hypothetical protein